MKVFCVLLFVFLIVILFVLYRCFERMFIKARDGYYAVLKNEVFDYFLRCALLNINFLKDVQGNRVLFIGNDPLMEYLKLWALKENGFAKRKKITFECFKEDDVFLEKYRSYDAIICVDISDFFYIQSRLVKIGVDWGKIFSIREVLYRSLQTQ